jgi:hypothetical protein
MRGCCTRDGCVFVFIMVDVSTRRLQQGPLLRSCVHVLCVHLRCVCLPFADWFLTGWE